MRLKNLILKNWRCFQGTQRIDFANRDNSNVTVIVGQNGSGKTAILNAFTWCLFGETTTGFRRTTDLFNHSALANLQLGQSETMEVTLEFEHSEFHYKAHRSQEAFLQQANATPTLSETQFRATRRQGGTEAITQEDIHSILPAELHPFFFFPAENIGKDFDRDDTAAIRASMSNAVDILLGIKRYEMALDVISAGLSRHLKLRNNHSQSNPVEIEERTNRLRESWENKNERRKKLPELIKQQEDICDGLETQLAASREHQENLYELRSTRKQIEDLEQVVQNATSQQTEIINSSSVILFGGELFIDAREVLDTAYKNNQIPPKVSAGLLEEMLDRERCICGKTIGDEERERLQKLRSQTVEDYVAEVASNLRGRVPFLAQSDGHPRDHKAATEFNEQVQIALGAETELRNLKKHVSEMLRDQPELESHVDQDKTQLAWKNAQIRLTNLKNELDNLGKELPELERTKMEAEREYHKALKRLDHGRKIGEAREILSNVEATLSQIQKALRDASRQDVERAMNQFYSKLLLKNYRIKLNDDFTYEVEDINTNRIVGASSSEIALATFAFVGALAGLMPTYANLDRLLPKEGEPSPGSLSADKTRAYPVVLDAPYSPFGEDYSSRFSEQLPDLLPQSVIIIRADQIQYIESMIKAKRVGNAYVLRLHSNKEKGSSVQWLGKNIDYVVKIDKEIASHTQVIQLPLE